MAGLGTIANMALVLAGSVLGLLLKKAIPERIKTSVVQALSLGVIVIGIIGCVTAACSVENNILSSNFILLMVISLSLGTVIGSVIDIERRLNSLGAFLEKHFSSDASSTFAEGFITASLVYCIGSMAILGSLNDGIFHDPTILITKGIIDGVMSVIFASTLGIGVAFSVFSIAVYQGLITFCASLLAPLLTDTLICQMSLTGSVLIMGIGLNLIYKPNLKLANMLPSIFIPVIYYIFQSLVGRFF